MNKIADKLRFNIRFKLTSETLAIMAAVLFFNQAAIRFALSNTIGRVGLGSLVDLVYGTVFIGAVLLCALIDRKRLLALLTFLGVLAAVGVYFLGTLAVHPDYEYYYTREVFGVWEKLFSPITGCIYGFLVILLCKKPENVWVSLKYTAWIGIVYYSIRVLLASRIGYWTGYNAAGNMIDITYDLGVGYGIIFVAIIFICMFHERKKKLYLLPAAYSVFLVLSNGSRGALICVGVCVMLLIVCKGDEWRISRKRKALIALTMGFIGLLLAYFDQLVATLGTWLSAAGIQSRTIESMLSGTMLASNGRDTITAHALRAMFNSGFFGLGAYGDRPYIAPYYWWGYCHNIALELMCDFGWILGPIIIALLCYALIHIFFKQKSETYRYIYIIFLSICCKLLISDSFWNFPQFWALLGIIFMFYRYEGRPINRTFVKGNGQKR